MTRSRRRTESTSYLIRPRRCCFGAESSKVSPFTSSYFGFSAPVGTWCYRYTTKASIGLCKEGASLTDERLPVRSALSGVRLTDIIVLPHW